MVLLSMFWTLGTIFESSLAWVLSRTNDAQNILEKMALVNRSKLPPGKLTVGMEEKSVPSEYTPLLSSTKKNDLDFRSDSHHFGDIILDRMLYFEASYTMNETAETSDRMDGENSVYTLDEALASVGFGKFQGLLLAYAGLGWFSDAMEVMILSFVGPAVKSQWDLSPGQESLLTTVVFAGMLVGAVTWGLVSDYYGRRQVVMPRLSWRWLLAFSTLPSIALLVLYGIVPESPRYLCTKGRISDAHNILEKIALVNQSKLPPGILVFERMVGPEEKSIPSEYAPLLSSTRKKVVDFKSGFASFVMLFSSKLIRTTLLLWVLFFGNAFSYYGIILLTSELRSEQSTCGSTVLRSENLQEDSLYINSATLTIALLSGARMCIEGNYAVASVYTPELYPTTVRATGAGVANAVGRIGGMVCPLVAVGLVTGCRLTEAIILFEVVMVTSAVCVLLFPLETKGQDLRDSVDVSDSTQVVAVG
ncbi:unnamed protein product [Dovyalis caffra]|uniref:Major facilitator superfamily (MFS) profile domain-containing protein n=1 Tax=Dovyalis caffra TaxID=77055 RepID=A0AAV1S3X0_9ROSI|nr:unnamed protein product [Dovyalis caffra]